MRTIIYNKELMPHQIKNIKQWIDILRDGNLKQTRGITFKDGCYCAMGAAMKSIGGLETQNGIEQGIEFDGYVYSAYPDYDVFKFQFGFDVNLNLFDQNGTSVWRMNDNYGLPFDEIANVLEAVFITKKPYDYHPV